MTEQELLAIKAEAFSAGYQQAIDDYTQALLEARRTYFENLMAATGNKLTESFEEALEAYTSQPLKSKLH